MNNGEFPEKYDKIWDKFSYSINIRFDNKPV